jgi:hypothetical protein
MGMSRWKVRPWCVVVSGVTEVMVCVKAGVGAEEEEEEEGCVA